MTDEGKAIRSSHTTQCYYTPILSNEKIIAQLDFLNKEQYAPNVFLRNPLV